MSEIPPPSAARTAKLDLRLSPEAKRTLMVAARLAHRSVSQFVLDSALARAEETLADRRKFVLEAPQWEAFLAALDVPPAPMPRLRRLFRESGPFDNADAE